GSVKFRSFKAAPALENTFAVPTWLGTAAPLGDSLRVMLEFSGAFSVDAEVRKKFVGKLKPLAGLSGKPDRHRPAPVISHPPIKASKARPAEFPKRRPRPNGKSKSTKPLKLCRKSKSDAPRLSPGWNGF